MQVAVTVLVTYHDLQIGDQVLSVCRDDGEELTYGIVLIVDQRNRYVLKHAYPADFGWRFKVHRRIVGLPATSPATHPHKCPRCGGAAYAGFAKVDCLKCGG